MTKGILYMLIAFVLAGCFSLYYFFVGVPQVPLRPEPTKVENTVCKVTGCSSQICADEEMTTTCEYKEEYICYQKAKCEKQQNGKCGWTGTEILKACLLQYE